MPKTTLKTSIFSLLNNDLIKLWLQNTTSLNSRAAKQADLQEFRVNLHIKAKNAIAIPLTALFPTN